MILYVATKDPDAVFEACEAQGDVMDREACISPKQLPDGRFVLALCVSRPPELPEGAEILGEKWKEIPSAIQMAAGLVVCARGGPTGKWELATVPGERDVVVAAGQKWVAFQGVSDE